MGGGTWTNDSFARYSKSVGHKYDADTNRLTAHSYTARKLTPALSPRDCMRECVNSEEHPNTIPVILGLDVTGSMGSACSETAAALSSIMKSLFDKYKDIEFMIMGIGDLECDDAPVQISQFESDVRIAKWLDDIYMEHGGGGNGYESYSAAWYMGLHHTRLDCFDKQGRKGIIITMGDEPLNPFLRKEDIKTYVGDKIPENINTEALYKEASKKFDIFHISIDDTSSSYKYNACDIDETFSPLLKENAKISTIEDLPEIIIRCIDSALKGTSVPDESEFESETNCTSNGEISW